MDDQNYDEVVSPEPAPEPASPPEPTFLPETEAPPERTGRTWLIAGAVGALMLVLGAFLGSYGRGQFGPEAQAAKAAASATAVAVETQAAASAQMMDYLIENTRHFKGDENAPVTIIEFSDFQ